MKEFVEKLIGRLEEQKGKYKQARANTHCVITETSECDSCRADHYLYARLNCVDKSIEIVNQLAEEYNNGWIPYATGEELPNNGQKVWLSFTTEYTSFVKSAYWIYDHFEWENGKKVKDFPTAWKPYKTPEPYQKGE